MPKRKIVARERRSYIKEKIADVVIKLDDITTELCEWSTTRGNLQNMLSKRQKYAIDIHTGIGTSNGNNCQEDGYPSAVLLGPRISVAKKDIRQVKLPKVEKIPPTWCFVKDVDAALELLKDKDVDVDAALDLFNKLFCMSCFVFGCRVHGCSPDQGKAQVRVPGSENTKKKSRKDTSDNGSSKLILTGKRRQKKKAVCGVAGCAYPARLSKYAIKEAKICY